MANLPVEWKSTIAALPPEDQERIESLVARGCSAPLPSDKEVGPFLLFMLGDTIEDVANKTGIPKDVVYLTYIQYGWEKKRDALARAGNVMIIGALQKQLVNHLLVATSMSVLSQVGRVMSGELPPEKCPLIPRSLHGLKALLDMVSEANSLMPDQGKHQTVITAQNVQVNQGVQLESPPNPEVETIEVRRRAFLEKMAEDEKEEKE